MVSRENKRATLHEKLQLLRSVTNSQATTKSSIILEASNYIKDLKKKIQKLNNEISCPQNTIDEEDQLATSVTVEPLEKGFLIYVFSKKNCPGLLVSVLEVFEELGLNVLEARASCADEFHLKAVGEEDLIRSLDAQMVKEAVHRAMNSCTRSSSKSSVED